MNRTTILVVDDDADNRRLAGEALLEARISLRIEYCINGEDLLSYLRKEQEYSNRKADPALILLDLNMPKMDGFSALKEIKSCPKCKKIPIIIFSTSNREDDLLTARRLGADEYIIKPAGFGQMVWIFKDLLDKYIN